MQQGSTGVPPRRPNGAGAGPLGTPGEPVGLGSKPAPKRAAPADKSAAADPPAPRRQLMGKELTDAVAGILAGHQAGESDDEQGEGEGQDAGDDGTARREAGAGRDDGDEGVGDESGGGEEGESVEHDATLEEVARALRLKPAELNRMQLTVDGQRVNLGELKAGWSRVAKLDHERAEFEDRVTVTELEQIDAHRRIMAVIDSFPDRALPPAVLQRVNQQHEQNRQEQAALLTKARPDWGDPKYVERERGAMLGLAKRYGFSAAEVGAILDHRHILILQDFAHALARIDAAKGAARKVDLAGNKPLPAETARAAINGRSAGQSSASNKSLLAKRVADLIARGG
jgi:hypothetical protein